MCQALAKDAVFLLSISGHEFKGLPKVRGQLQAMLIASAWSLCAKVPAQLRQWEVRSKEEV